MPSGEGRYARISALHDTEPHFERPRLSWAPAEVYFESDDDEIAMATTRGEVWTITISTEASEAQPEWDAEKWEVHILFKAEAVSHIASEGCTMHGGSSGGRSGLGCFSTQSPDTQTRRPAFSGVTVHRKIAIILIDLVDLLLSQLDLQPAEKLVQTIRASDPYNRCCNPWRLEHPGKGYLRH